MKTASTLYFIASLFLMLCMDEAPMGLILSVFTNLIVSYFVARKYAPHLFWKN